MPAYTKTLGDARDLSSGLPQIAGVCSTGDAFKNYVNIATRRLMKRGSWFTTDQVAKFCYEGCDVVFPRWVGTVQGVKLCCAGEIPVNNNWGQILGPTSAWNNGLYSNMNWGNGGYGMYGGASGWMGVVDNGMVPIYSQVSGTTGKQIAYHISRPEDIGKTITLYGKFYGGMPLAQLRNGVWSEGLTITAISAGGDVLPAMTSPDKLVAQITSVVRDKTSGPCWLYEYGQDSTGTNALRDIAQYQPSEDRPRYRRMKINGICAEPACEDSYGRKIRSLEAICHLEFIPVEADSDFLLLSDFDALGLAIQGRILEEAGDTQNAELKYLSAIRELQYEERTRRPARQTSVRVNVGGDYCLTNPT